MEYRRLGRSGINISEISFGSWLTFGERLDLDHVKKCMKEAVNLGVNFFDNAEVYGNGAAELLMGEALRDYKREDVVVSTKIFWGGSGPNGVGHSKKRLTDGLKNSLRRLQLSYVDLVFCHRRDNMTSIEETVQTMDLLIRQGLALYWGTSEWTAQDIEEAFFVAKELGCIPPTMEQPEYNLLKREKVEQEFKPLFEKYGLGTTIWSPLAFGILTGKYNKGTPPGSRLDRHPEFAQKLTEENLKKVAKLKNIAKDLGCKEAQLAIAWCLKNPNVTCAIVGATSAEQLLENIQAIEIKNQIDESCMKKIEACL